jgi:hypothetical protein
MTVENTVHFPTWFHSHLERPVLRARPTEAAGPARILCRLAENRQLEVSEVFELFEVLQFWHDSVVGQQPPMQ